MKRRSRSSGRWIWVVIAIGIICGYPLEVRAEDATDTGIDTSVQGMMDDMDFTEIQEVLDGLSGGDRIDFGEMVSSFISGETEFSFELIWEMVKDRLFYEINYNRDSIVQIIMIAVVAAIFANFSGVFQNQQISEVSFYVIYLLMITILLASFQIMMNTATDTLSEIVDFTHVLAPVYLMSIAMAGGATTATVFYNVLIFAIYAVNWFILHFVVPLIQVYVVLVLVNHLAREDFLSRFADLIKTAVEWMLKTIFGLVIGINMIQGLLAPVIDSVRTSVLNKAAGAIPGIGGAANAVTEVVLGSAVLIKNGIGVAALVILVVICVVPVLKLAIFVLMYKFAAAVIQPISDRRMTGCVSGVGEGADMLLKVVLTAMALFFITIAMVAAATS